MTDPMPVQAVQLHLLRHAHAGDYATWDGPDEARPLSPRGERQADRLGRFLAGIGFRTDAIITSPKVRALQTAEIVAERLGVPFGTDDRLAEGFGLTDLEAILRDAGDPVAPILVGHDPDFSELLADLCGGSAYRCARAPSPGSMPSGRSSPAVPRCAGLCPRTCSSRTARRTDVPRSPGSTIARAVLARVANRSDALINPPGTSVRAIARHPLGHARCDPVEDPLAAAFRGDEAGFAQDPQVVRDGRLADVAGRGEVARARLGLGGKLADDREAGGVREGGQEADVGVRDGGLVRAMPAAYR